MSKALFITGAAMSAIGAGMLRSKLAFGVPLAIMYFAGDSEAMSGGRPKWNTPPQGGITQELEELKQQVNKLLEDLKSRAHWEAGSYELVSGQCEDFSKQLDNMGGQRNCVGDALGASAKHWDVLGKAAVAIGGVMITLGILRMTGKLSVITSWASELAAAKGTQQASKTTMGFLQKAMMMGMAVWGIYELANMQGQQMAMKFQDMKVTPATFGAAALGNDSKSGAVTPKPITDPAMSGMGNIPGAASI